MLLQQSDSDHFKQACKLKTIAQLPSNTQSVISSASRNAKGDMPQPQKRTVHRIDCSINQRLIISSKLASLKDALA